MCIADDVVLTWFLGVQGIRETSRIGIAPRRKESEFNRKEFDMAVLDKMVGMVEPDRPRNYQGNFLNQRQAIDANKAMLFDSHPEMMVCLLHLCLPTVSKAAFACFAEPLGWLLGCFVCAVNYNCCADCAA